MIAAGGPGGGMAAAAGTMDATSGSGGEEVAVLAVGPGEGLAGEGFAGDTTAGGAAPAGGGAAAGSIMPTPGAAVAAAQRLTVRCCDKSSAGDLGTASAGCDILRSIWSCCCCCCSCAKRLVVRRGVRMWWGFGNGCEGAWGVALGMATGVCGGGV